MGEIVSQIVGSVMNILTSYITKHLGYVTSSTKNVKQMIKKMKILEGKREGYIDHMKTNQKDNKEIPTRVHAWLIEVDDVKNEVESIPSNITGCFNMKKRYRAGRNAVNIIEDIERLTNEEITWTDVNIPLARVATKPASPPLPSPSSSPLPSPSPSGEYTRNVFESRDKTFKEALKFLQQDGGASQVIALCGMGGVGKTTMMIELKKVVGNNKMFKWIVKVVIGRKPNMLTIQKDIAAYLNVNLPEGSKDMKADYLCKTFENLSQDNEKILVILDDVWEMIELKDIGLTCPLPKNIKLLLTSRYSGICSEIAAYADSVLQVVRVDVLEEAEAQNLFFQTACVSKEDDNDKYLIGCDIVKKCRFLPMAIKLIASTLKSKEDYAWRDKLGRLKNNELDDNVQEIIKISYEYLKDDKEILLLCSLFPEDYDIQIEDLMRHAWGLNLLKNVSTMREARDRVNTYAQNLINANLLIKSEHVGCVKMHDLVLAFVLGRISSGDPSMIINHAGAYKWGRDEMGESWKRVSLTCTSMPEFPKEFKYPNLSLLQLMHGELSLFPEDFYESMENLQVIAYYNMQYPLLPRSFPCPNNLKTLCLNNCKVMHDCSFVGYLVNLEVLSFANCVIHKLPSTIENLVKLKLLDLTGCVINDFDDGVFGKLGDLEELYMGGLHMSFTGATREEMTILSKQLFALVVGSLEKKTQLENVSFENLDKFKMSIGCDLDEENTTQNYMFENTLKLMTDNNSDLLECKISGLFRKTKKLHLHVKDMIRLEDVFSIHPCNEHSFRNLRELEVSGCRDLKYLFPVPVASGLTNLESLRISKCSVLEAVVHNDGSEINSHEIINFEKLKFMSLKQLPKLEALFLVESVVELPQLVELKLAGLTNFTSIYHDENNLSALQQPVVNSKVKISKLEKLKIYSMENLKQIWACSSEEEVNDISMLREIKVKRCFDLVNLFPTNPMRLLNFLEVLKVIECNSIEEIFNIDLRYVGDFENLGSSNNKSSLKIIQVVESHGVKEVWRIKGAENNANSMSHFISGFEAIKSIEIKNCMMFRNVFTPSNINLDMGANVRISDFSKLGEDLSSDHPEHEEAALDVGLQDWEENPEDKELAENSENEEIMETEGDHNTCEAAFPSNLMHAFPYLEELDIDGRSRVDVVFDLDSSGCNELVTATNNQPPLLPNLQRLLLYNTWQLRHVWKCNNWSNFLNCRKGNPQLSSSFHSLTTIHLILCNTIEYLFSPLIAELLPNLKELQIRRCQYIEEVVSNRDDKHEEDEKMATNTTTNIFPHLQLLRFHKLEYLKRIGGVHDQLKLSQVGIVPWSLCQYSREIDIWRCHALSSVIPSYAVGHMQKLEVLKVTSCESLTEVFETQGSNNNSGSGSGSISTNIDEAIDGTDPTLLAIPRQENINVPHMSNLKILVIAYCNHLQYMFTFSTLASLRQLKELTIKDCEGMKVIVKNEDGGNKKRVLFPRLETLELLYLPNLEGFFLGNNEFQWPLLKKVMIGGCPQMTVFTSAHSSTPKLKYIHTLWGKYSLECGLNFNVTRDLHQTLLPGSKTTSSYSPTFEGKPQSFPNLVELDIEGSYFVIHANELLQPHNLEKIHIKEKRDFSIKGKRELFNLETNNVFYESPDFIEVRKLRELDIFGAFSIKYLWKSNPNGTVLKFPNLTTVSIQFCNELGHVFTISMMDSLVHLRDLYINCCAHIEVIVKVEEEENEEKKEEGDGEGKYKEEKEDEEEEKQKECDEKVKEIVLPRLESLKLQYLSSLKGFCLGNITFKCPLLHTLEIKDCSKILVFTNGHVITPALKIINTSIGMCYVGEDLNSFIKTEQSKGTFSSASSFDSWNLVTRWQH